MSGYSYNVGSDTTLTLISNGVIIAATVLTGFEARQMTAALDSVGLDGVNRFVDIEKGWEGTLEWDRADSILDDYFAAKEAGRYSGSPAPTISITETTTNVDGSVVKYRYDGVSLKYDTIGKRAGDAKVEPRVSWRGSRRIKVQ